MKKTYLTPMTDSFCGIHGEGIMDPLPLAGSRTGAGVGGTPTPARRNVLFAK